MLDHKNLFNLKGIEKNIQNYILTQRDKKFSFIYNYPHKILPSSGWQLLISLSNEPTGVTWLP